MKKHCKEKEKTNKFERKIKRKKEKQSKKQKPL